MSTKQLALFKSPPKPKPKHKRSHCITDYGTLLEWDRDLTPCERSHYLTPFPRTGRTWATFYQLKTTPWGWFGRHYKQGSDRVHIRLFRRNTT